MGICSSEHAAHPSPDLQCGEVRKEFEQPIVFAVSASDPFGVTHGYVQSAQPQEPADADTPPSACDTQEARLSAFRLAIRESKTPVTASFSTMSGTSGVPSDFDGSFEKQITESSDTPMADDIDSCESDDEDFIKDGELPDYGNPDFWKEVYSGVSKWQKCVPSEWFLEYRRFKELRWHRYLRGGSILELGCGNSNFMSDAYDDGFDDITCVDIDANVVETMRAQNAALRPGIKYFVCDAMDMRKLCDKSFEIIFDKGTVDALSCAGQASTRRCFVEAHRVLKDSGLYLCVSFTSPEQMIPAIKDTGSVRHQWQVQVLNWRKPEDACHATLKVKSAEDEEGEDGVDCDHQEIYMYVCRKALVRMGSVL